MTAIRTYDVDLAAGRASVREAGEGEPVGFLAGLGGVPTWLPFLDELARRRRVVVPSLPGFPGSSVDFHQLDDHLDWLTATLDLLDAAGLSGADLIASSVAGMLAADIAALSPALVRRLVLISPWGLYDPSQPGRDYFAEVPDLQPGLLSVQPERLAEAMAPPPGVDPVDSRVAAYRASEAAARLSWPMGDRGLRKRQHRITQRTLLLWGEQDIIVPPSYADQFAAAIRGPVEVAIVPEAGHLCVVDQPTIAAKHVLAFLES